MKKLIHQTEGHYSLWDIETENLKAGSTFKDKSGINWKWTGSKWTETDELGNIKYLIPEY